MPATARLFRDGSLSWSVVRGVVVAVRRFGRATRAQVDGRLAASVETAGRWSGDADQLLARIEQAVDDARGIAAVERREAREAGQAWLAVQQGLFGGLRLAGEYPDAEQAAVVCAAIRAYSPAPTAEACEPAGTGGGGGAGGSGRARQQAAGLLALCETASAPDTAAGAAVMPGEGKAAAVVVARVDLRDRSAEPAHAAGQQAAATPGVIDVPVRGAPDRVSLAKVERVLRERGGVFRAVACSDGEPVAVSDPLHVSPAESTGTIAVRRRGRTTTLPLDPARAAPGDLLARLAALARESASLRAAAAGARPLTAPALVDAEDIPSSTRMAVSERDRGCRFPVCDAPLDWCDVHHLVARAEGGEHHPSNLVAICRRHHTQAHRRGWRLRLDPASGEVTASRGRRTWRSLPHGTPLAPARAPTPSRADPHRDRAAHELTDASEPLPF
jgi:hypothetical protein